jgi:DNA primase
LIPKSKIDEIVYAARVDEVVGDYVTLKKRGSSLIGLCPFHNEKTPSFNVSATKGIYKCFGCGKAGNAVNFVMEIEHLNYIQALKHLAEKYQIEWPEQQISNEEIEIEKQRQSERESIQIINNFAENYFADILENDEEGKTIGLSYFEERGFREETIKKFKLGYSKDVWDHFANTAIKNGFNIELLKKSGLIKESEQGKIFDAYRGRVMFTIHSLSGKPIAFAGRFLKKDPKSPKYVNSPETELYHKSNELYGLYFAKQAISKIGYVYLVEGYTDVISLHQSGIENVVASSGTSLTENQIKLIKRFTDNVCVLYDGDAAGIKASLRGIDMLLEGGLNVKVVLFPDGEDPDSYAQKLGPVDFATYLEKSKKDFIFFKTSLLMEDAGNDPVKRAQLIREIVESIAKVPDAIKRSGFIKESAKILKADEQLLINEINKILRNKNQETKKILPEAPIEKNYLEELKDILDLQLHDHQERDIIRVLIEHGTKDIEGYKNVAHFILHEIHEHQIELDHPIITEIINGIASQLEQDNLNIQDFVNHTNPHITTFIATILSEQHEVSPHWERRFDIIMDEPDANFLQDIESALNRLKLKHIEKLIIQNQEEFNRVTTDEDIETLQKIHQHLIEERKILTLKVGTVIVK